MHGPLGEISLIEVLQLLHRGRRSGVLQVTSDDGARTIAVRLANGAITALEPDAGDEALRLALVARHLDASDAPNRAARLASDAARALRTTLAMRAFGELMQWTEGRFDFREEPAGAGPLDLAPDDVIFQLVDAETRRLELAGEFDQFAMVPAFAAVDALASGAAHLPTPAEWRVLDQVDGARDLAALAHALGEPVEDVAESIRALQRAAILELRTPAADPVAAAHSAINAGRFDDAAVLLRERVDAHPHDPAAWRLLGLAEAGAGRFERAIAAWRAWQSAEPARADDAAALALAAGTMMEALRDHRD